MKNCGADFAPVLTLILALAVNFPLGVAAQTPLPPQPASVVANLPRDLTLQQAEQLLLQRNLAVLAAKYQVEANRAARLIASFRPNPTLTIGAEQFNLSNKLFHNIARTDSNSAAATTYALRYDQLIERGGKRELRTELADCQLKASEAQMLDAARTQLYQLRQAFTSAALARENLLLAQSTQEQYERTIRLTAAKVESGDLAGVELYRAQAASLQFQQAVQQARTSYQQATRDILNLLGARAEDIQSTGRVASLKSDSVGNDGTDAKFIEASLTTALPGKDEFADEPLRIDFKFDDRPIAISLAEMRDISLAERPDVMAARNLYEAAMKGVSLAQAQRARDWSVGTFLQRIGSDQTAGVNVSIPLFLHNKGLAAISQAEAQKEAAAALVRQTELQAVTDVEKANLAYQSARHTLDLYNSTTLERAGKLKAIAAVSYREGASSLLELLDAERTYNQTINAYNQARADYQMALWQLEQAIGRPLR